MKLVHVGNTESTSKFKPWESLAEEFGLELGCIHSGHSSKWSKDVALLHDAALVIIWNGQQGTSTNVREYCLRRSIPFLCIEWGMLPQEDTYFVDPLGFNSKSSLMGPLNWVGENHLSALRQKRDELQREFPLQPQGHVLVPLQILSDTQVMYHSCYNSMHELIEDLAVLFPNQKVLIRPHPKSGCKTTVPISPNQVLSDCKEPFLAEASKASVVVGINSTCLIEAGVLGVPVFALGDCPIRHHPRRNHELLFAAYLSRCCQRKDRDVLDIMYQVGVTPIGCEPETIKAALRVRERDKYLQIYRCQGTDAASKPTNNYGHTNHGKGAVELVDKGPVLDVGCGWGEFVATMRDKGVEATGLDFACPGADVNGSFQHLPFPDRSFELLTSFDVLEHLISEDIPIAMAEMKRVAPRFIVSIGTHRSEWRGLTLHPTVAPLSWWARRFKEAGASVTRHGKYLVGSWQKL